MKLLEQVQRGPVAAPRRTLLYGVHGVGKSSWGAIADAPIFIQTEDGLADIDCQRFPLATKYADVLAALGELYTEPHK
ncbi:MAG: AAA family ATPase, partial [Phycisphaerae bacterium]|nr:AAA family ATPase [Phycisphaerae bacterium]